VAIIYASAANRFAAFPVEAERANFIAITTQLQSAINMEMLLGVGFGNVSASAQMAGMNPMDFLLETPSNYLGVFDVANAMGLDRRSWYFDSVNNELVYRVSGENRVVLQLAGNEIPTMNVRFKIVADYSQFYSESGLPVPSGGERKFTGVVLRRIVPFRWFSGEERGF
jgi:hypothetical protein